MTPEIHKFLQDLLHDAGQTDLGKELEDQMIEDLNTRLEDRLMLAAMEKLTESQQLQLEGMVEQKKDTAEIQKFIEQSIPEYTKVMSEAMMEFRDTYVAASKGEEE